MFMADLLVNKRMVLASRKVLICEMLLVGSLWPV